MAYVCAELINGVCSTWVEQASLIPPLSFSEGVTIGGKIIICWFTAWCLGFFLNFSQKM